MMECPGFCRPGQSWDSLHFFYSDNLPLAIPTPTRSQKSTNVYRCDGAYRSRSRCYWCPWGRSSPPAFEMKLDAEDIRVRLMNSWGYIHSPFLFSPRTAFSGERPHFFLDSREAGLAGCLVSRYNERCLLYGRFPHAAPTDGVLTSQLLAQRTLCSRGSSRIVCCFRVNPSAMRERSQPAHVHVISSVICTLVSWLP